MRTRVKICGITNAEDAAAAVDAGADALGVVLAPSSRRVTLEQAAQALALVPPLVSRVGVFVDPTADEVREAVRRLRLDLVEFCGDESREVCIESPVPVLKVIHVGTAFDTESVEPYRGLVAAFLFDTHVTGKRGGTGKVFSWHTFGESSVGAPFIVAGGLDPYNVGDAIRALRPYAVDVSSGVERAPGHKDHAKLRAFISAVRQADLALESDPNASDSAPLDRCGGLLMSDALLPSAESAYSSPDAQGFFGPYGGRFVPETVVPALDELTKAYREASSDPAFADELATLLRDYVGRPTPLYRAERLAQAVGLGTVYLKREDLCHTGAHKINNTLGQCLLAKRMGKNRVIAETGAGQHGVATATAAALMDMECVVFMGVEDIRRQALNVYKMQLLGAAVVPVEEGTGTLADAVTAALRHWVERVRDTFYVLGSAVGPHPYPMMVRDFQKVIGEETVAQLGEKGVERVDAVCACVGGGSNAIGMFYPFVVSQGADSNMGGGPLLFGAEAAGLGIDTDKTGASMTLGTPGVMHGFYSYLLQDDAGNPLEAYSISAGLDYPGVGPEHAYLKDEALVRYEPVTDGEALQAFELLCRTEGIIPAIESSHALALLPRLARELGSEATVVVTLSGRGDKDIDIVREAGLGLA